MNPETVSSVTVSAEGVDWSLPSSTGCMTRDQVYLILPMAPASLNLLLRMHWAQRRKVNALWTRAIWAELCQFKLGRRIAFAQAKVEIERRSPKLLDADNLHGACKPVLDALVVNGVVEDDSPDHITLVTKQCRGAPQTTIRVTRK